MADIWIGFLVFIGVVATSVFLIVASGSKELPYEVPAVPRRRALDRSRMSRPMRIHHLWLRSMAIQDEKMAILDEACSLYGVDPDVDSRERSYVEECFLNPHSSMTPAICGIRISEMRMEDSEHAKDE